MPIDEANSAPPRLPSSFTGIDCPKSSLLTTYSPNTATLGILTWLGKVLLPLKRCLMTLGGFTEIEWHKDKRYTVTREG